MTYTTFDFGDSVISPATVGGGSTLEGPAFPSSGGGSSVAPFASDILSGVVGTAYSVFIDATGGTSPYTFALQSGALPTGLSLNTSTGEISGTPTVAGSYSFVIRATDSASAFGDQTFQIIIAAASGGGGAGNYGWIA